MEDTHSFLVLWVCYLGKFLFSTQLEYKEWKQIWLASGDLNVARARGREVKLLQTALK